MTGGRRRTLFTTDFGIEDILAEELADHGVEKDRIAWSADEPGSVIVSRDCEGQGDGPAWAALGTVHHVVELLGETRARDLDAVRAFVSEVAIPELETAASFRVSSTCDAASGLDRMAVQQAAGAVLQRRHGTPVDLEGYALHVRVDGRGARVRLGLQRTREPLSRRIRRGGVLRSSLRPTLAAAMLRMAGAHRGTGALLDPMCGAGVIPVEAARLNPRLSVSASDWDEPTVALAAGTFANHGLAVTPEVLDARALGDLRPAAYDLIVTDPPYGVRQGTRTRLGALYGELLRSLSRALKPGGRMVWIVARHALFTRAVVGAGLTVLQRRNVSAGNLRLTIFVLVAPR